MTYWIPAFAGMTVSRNYTRGLTKGWEKSKVRALESSLMRIPYAQVVLW
jgi:hypothetical protein